VLTRVSRAAWQLDQGRAGTHVGAGLGPRRGDLDPHPGRGDRAATLPGAPARGRCRPGRARWAARMTELRAKPAMSWSWPPEVGADNLPGYRHRRWRRGRHAARV